LVGGLTQRTRFLDGGQLFLIDFTRFFTPFYTFFLLHLV